MKAFGTISDDFRIWGEVQRHKVAIIVLCQCAREGGDLSFVISLSPASHVVGTVTLNDPNVS
jgi:hypothetical protein